jgi:hypothetical protein
MTVSRWRTSTEGGDVMRVRKTDRKVASTLSLQKAN